MTGRVRDEVGFVGALLPERLGWGELVFVADGTLDVEYRGAYWPVRAGQALWHPGSGLDSASAWGETRVLRLGVSEPPAVGPRLVRGSLLLQEVLVRLAEGFEPALMRVALSELDCCPSIPLSPPWPRALWASNAAIVLRDVGRDEMSLEWLAGKLEMSRRSFERRFIQETGLSPGDWRREARLIESLRLLSMGTRGDLSGTVGFGSRSAFYAAFHARFGLGPVRFWETFLGSE